MCGVICCMSINISIGHRSTCQKIAYDCVLIFSYSWAGAFPDVRKLIWWAGVAVTFFRTLVISFFSNSWRGGIFLTSVNSFARHEGPSNLFPYVRKLIFFKFLGAAYFFDRPVNSFARRRGPCHIFVDIRKLIFQFLSKGYFFRHL